MTDYMAVAAMLARWWRDDADPCEVVETLLGEQYDGSLPQLIRAAVKAEQG